MNIYTILLAGALAFSSFSSVCHGQSTPDNSSTAELPMYDRARIYYSNQQQFMALLRQGLPMDHGTHKINYYFESDFSRNELNIARMMGFQVEVIISDVSQYYRDRNKDASAKPSSTDHQKNATCSSGSTMPSYTTPANWELGSMGGFYTYSEMLAELDDMQTLYPNLITAKSPISTFLTEEGRPIYWVKISDNPNTDEAEPEVLYDAIHHAREPVSMQQLIFYMWYLLENYDTDDEVKKIVDNAELYFIPVLNPDGYVYNETTQPAGGGMWRKNRRNNGGGNFGVDNNRNYGYAWNTTGVSSDPANDTYPGTAAFSEVENQAMKWFCENREFKIAMNNHSYDNSLLYPFGYESNMLTPDNDYIVAATGVKVAQNSLGMVNKLSSLLYPASGDSDDWMYDGDLATKPKIFGYTPEIGDNSHGFWPAINDIETVCESMVYTNLTTAKLVLNYATVKDVNELYITNQNDYFHYQIQRLGLDGTGDFSVSIVPVSSNILSVGNANSHSAMQLMDMEMDSIAYTLVSNIQEGDVIVYEVVVNNGLYDEKITVQKIYGTPSVAFFDGGANMSNWTGSGSWGIATSDYFSSPSSFADSPNGNYTSNVNSSITFNPTIDLTNALSASVSYMAKWEIEDGYDYAQFMVSTNNGSNWIPQCGKYTKTGSGNQHSGFPIYDGTQLTWVKEEIDLSDYLGEQIKFRFRFRSDWGDNRDGFYFDDFQVNVIYGTSGVNELENGLLQVLAAVPNPANDRATIFYSLPNEVNDAILVVYNETGQVVESIPLSSADTNVSIELTQFSSGIYFYQLQSKDLRSTTKKLVKL
jgi:carboxypeptidase T